MQTEIHCPVDGCDWTVDATPPQAAPSALAFVFGIGTMAATAAFQHAHKIEGELEQHLGQHTTLEWVRTVQTLRDERDTLIRQRTAHARLCDGDIPGSPGCICEGPHGT